MGHATFFTYLWSFLQTLTGVDINTLSTRFTKAFNMMAIIQHGRPF